MFNELFFHFYFLLIFFLLVSMISNKIVIIFGTIRSKDCARLITVILESILLRLWISWFWYWNKVSCSLIIHHLLHLQISIVWFLQEKAFSLEFLISKQILRFFFESLFYFHTLRNGSHLFLYCSSSCLYYRCYRGLTYKYFIGFQFR